MSGLETYRAKRDFSVTPEPAPGAEASPGWALAFVVQKHDARRLHFDLRLEWGGVLWSWAVTKGPSALPGEKRLAVRTEDHPLDYGEFEGTIPEGEYGAGTVMLWDRGTWQPEGDPEAGIAGGKLKFRLGGARMRGGWTLVRMRTGGTAENWLLIKEKDAHAGRSADALVDRHRTSVTTGRSMAEIARGKAPERRERRKSAPGFRAVQLATLEDAPPEGGEWLHEPKFDGYRCLIALGRGGARLSTRNGHDWTDRFGALKAPAEALPCETALIDGEVVAGGGTGGDFSALQKALKAGGALTFHAFDLLHLDGRDLTRKPFEARREALEALFGPVPERGPIRLSPFLAGTGAEALAAMCRAGGEGIVSKLAGAPYRGGRGRAWIKTKCARRAEFVIAGWMASEAAGRPFSSLVLASREKGRLVYRGRVGTGFDAGDMAELAARMRRIARKTAPFDDVPPEIRGASWVRPDLVAEIAYAEFTEDGRLRHPVYHGLRADKPAEEVSAMAEETLGRGDARIGGTRISSADRVVFPGAGFTKGDVARHYDRVAERMLETAAGHPASLVRCPEGVSKACFFQKHAGKGFPSALKTLPIRESKGTVEEYIYLSDRASVLAAVQMGTIEFHIWGSARDQLERPDRMVFDLDPDEGLGFGTVRAAAEEIRVALGQMGLPSVPMVTGGKGIHVIVPLRRTAEWETVKTFAKALATALSDRHPDRYVATMSKARRRGRIFIDWLRNERGATAIAPYSLRARPGARVAVPVRWEELAELSGAGAFTAADMEARLALPCPLREVAPKGIGRGVVEALGRWIGD